MPAKPTTERNAFSKMHSNAATKGSLLHTTFLSQQADSQRKHISHIPKKVTYQKQHSKKIYAKTLVRFS
jgi:hypothetical protein